MIKYIETVFVLESFIVVLHLNTEHTADMMVFSTPDQKYLYNQEATLDLRNFLRGVKMDVTNFKNYIVAVRMKSITLCQVVEDQVLVKELEMDENIRGVFQYCKFLTWNETHMAHPFQAITAMQGPSMSRWSTKSTAGIRPLGFHSSFG